jgi:hypothetical protein
MTQKTGREVRVDTPARGSTTHRSPDEASGISELTDSSKRECEVQASLPQDIPPDLLPGGGVEIEVLFQDILDFFQRSLHVPNRIVAGESVFGQRLVDITDREPGRHSQPVVPVRRHENVLIEQSDLIDRLSTHHHGWGGDEVPSKQVGVNVGWIYRLSIFIDRLTRTIDD